MLPENNEELVLLFLFEGVKMAWGTWLQLLNLLQKAVTSKEKYVLCEIFFGFALFFFFQEVWGLHSLWLLSRNYI